MSSAVESEQVVVTGVSGSGKSSGATILSHVNDSGFWLVSRYLGMDEKATLESWTVMTVLIALTGLASCIVLSLFF